MTSYVPSLESSLYLTDPQSIIGYTLRKMTRTIKDAVPILPDAIVSFPWLIANYVNQPDNLCNMMQSAIQNTLTNIFGTERSVTTTVTHTPDPLDPAQYNITMSILYTTIAGEVESTGTTISVDATTGRFIIPEDNFTNSFLPSS